MCRHVPEPVSTSRCWTYFPSACTKCTHTIKRVTEKAYRQPRRKSNAIITWRSQDQSTSVLHFMSNLWLTQIGTQIDRFTRRVTATNVRSWRHVLSRTYTCDSVTWRESKPARMRDNSIQLWITSVLKFEEKKLHFLGNYFTSLKYTNATRNKSQTIMASPSQLSFVQLRQSSILK